MKKLLSFLMVLVVIGVLAACGSESDGEESGSESGGDEDTYTIGISLPSATHGWMGALIENAETKAQEIQDNQNVEYVMTNAEDPNQQANDVDDLISQDVDAIVMLPIESAALSPVAQNIKDEGIPLVVVDRELENDAADVVVKGDNEGIGINAGEYFTEQLPDGGNVVEITGPPNSVTEQRGAGFDEAMQEAENIDVVASQDGNFSTEESLSVMQNILQSQEQIDAVFTQDDGMALGVVQAIREADRDDIQFVTGAGGSKEVFESIQDDGLISATFLYSPAMVEDGVEVASQLAQGEEPEDDMVIKEATEVSEENVDEHYDPDSKF